MSLTSPRSPKQNTKLNAYKTPSALKAPIKQDHVELWKNGFFSYIRDDSEYTPRTKAEQLTARPEGHRFHMGKATGATEKWNGIGGDFMPTEVGPSMEALKRPEKPVDPRPWATAVHNKYFSTPAHIPDPVTEKPKPMKGAFFNAGGVAREIGKPVQHVSTQYIPLQQPSRPLHHLNCSKPQTPKLPPVMPQMSGSASDFDSPRGSPRVPRHKTKPFRKREVFCDSARYAKGTFTQFTPYLPDPIPTRELPVSQPAFYTVHAKSKRTVPILVPWNEAGAQGLIDAARPSDLGASLTAR